MQRDKVLMTVLLTMAMWGANAQAEGEMAEILKANHDNGQKIFNEGKGDVPACMGCHGPDGMGQDAMGTPRLAGQGVQFLIKQLNDFATDKRMDTTMFVMNANAKGLSAQDRLDVAAFATKMVMIDHIEPAQLSNLKDLAASGTQVGQSHLGKSLVLYGNQQKGIPACQSCHGYNGRGVDPIYPQINYQKYTYLVNQLKKWRDGSRANDPMSQMQKVAQKMSDEDIQNAAAYLAGASPLTAGNTRLPEEHRPMAYDIR